MPEYAKCKNDRKKFIGKQNSELRTSRWTDFIIYTWQNDLVESEEWRVVLKFKIENHHDILKQIKILHEYDVPQWVYWESSSSKEYAQWIHDPSAC